MKENDDLNQKIYGNIHVYKCYKYDIAPPPRPGKKSKIPLFPKNRLKGDISVTTKKDDIYPTKYGISVEIPYY